MTMASLIAMALTHIYDQAWLYTWGFGFGGEFQDGDGRITFANEKEH